MLPADDAFTEIMGRILAERRREIGMTQEMLAFRCGLHPTYISQLERGLKSPTVRVLRLVAEALDTRASALLASAEAAASRSTPPS
jgi:transcriptional regulator with XRE-family HTH domain